MLDLISFSFSADTQKEKEENESKEQIWPLGRTLLILATK